MPLGVKPFGARGRFALPALEWRDETTAILAARNGECGYAFSTTKYFLGQPLSRTCGGDGMKCGERKQLSGDGYIACECYLPAGPQKEWPPKERNLLEP